MHPVGHGPVVLRPVEELKHFDVISDGSKIPVVAFKLSGDFGYTSSTCRPPFGPYGWQVPAYTMPPGAEDISVLRVVVREGFSADLARSLWRTCTPCSTTSTRSSPKVTSRRNTSRTDRAGKISRTRSFGVTAPGCCGVVQRTQRHPDGIHLPAYVDGMGSGCDPLRRDVPARRAGSPAPRRCPPSPPGGGAHLPGHRAVAPDQFPAPEHRLVRTDREADEPPARPSAFARSTAARPTKSCRLRSLQANSNPASTGLSLGVSSRPKAR